MIKHLNEILKRPTRFSLVLLVLANIDYFQHDVVTWIITLLYFLLIPGLLVANLFIKHHRSKWETISISLGLSLVLLMVEGLLLNTTHYLGVVAPLSGRNIYIILDIVTIVLAITNKNIKLALTKIVVPDKEYMLIFFALLLLPVLAIGGAIRLNNGASDILTMLMLFLTAVLFIVLAFRKKLEGLYPLAIVMIALSLLFAISLRGSYIVGHDIQREFYVFQLTDKMNYWNIAAFRDPYNACLSITILPTILRKLTLIHEAYIFKVVFQCIFAFGLVPIYLFIRQILGPRAALIGSMLFVSFPTFLNDMTMLNRQEIALIFFGLLMLLVTSDIARSAKSMLTAVFLLALILSHYSSSYVTLGIILLSYIIYRILTRNAEDKHTARSHTPLLRTSIILIALLCTFLWNTQITTTTNGLKSTIVDSFKGLIDQSGAESSDTSYSILAPPTESPEQLLATSSGTNSDNVQYAPSPNLPLTKFGKIISRLVSAVSINYALRSFYAVIYQLLVILGVTVLFFRYHKKPNHRDAYILALSISCVVLLVLQTILPQLSIDYGTLRFFQQALVVLAIPIIVASEFLLSQLGKHSRPILILFFALLFLDLSGFIPESTGGYPGQLSLNNSGPAYDIYYNQIGDFAAADWLRQLPSSHEVIAVDTYASKKLNYGTVVNKFATTSILQANPNDYIFLDQTNVKEGLFSVNINSTIIQYTYDSGFNNKDLVYVNQNDQVYGPAK